MKESGRGGGERGTGKNAPNIHSEGTDLPYGFDLAQLKRGLAALPYADGNIASFHRHLNLGKLVQSYVSKALRTLGLLNGGLLSDLGRQYVDAPAKRTDIIASAVRKYPAYDGIVKACDIDASLRASVPLRWVTDKLANEKHVSKAIARRAAHAFGALISEAGFGTVKDRAISWTIAPGKILSVASGTHPHANEPARSSNTKDGKVLPAVREEAAMTGHPAGESQKTFISHQQNLGIFTIRPALLGTSADMTTWTESQIRTYWEGHNRGLELVLEIAKEAPGHA